MDTNKILQDIATNFNKTAEEIRDSNIDDIFQDEPDELILEIPVEGVVGCARLRSPPVRRCDTPCPS